MSEEGIKNKSKEAFKNIVKQAINKTALANLVEECGNQKKTSTLVYTKLKPQSYLTALYPWQSKIVFRCRSKTLDIKTHQEYKYNDTICCWCNLEDETVSHIVNCGEDHIEIQDFDKLEEMDNAVATKVTRTTYRIQEFLEKVDYYISFSGQDILQYNQPINKTKNTKITQNKNKTKQKHN